MSWTGYIGVLVSVLGFGSNFVPLKRLKIGDGVFFQFIMCNAIFMTSLPVLIIQKFPKMHGLAILGGFLWCSGNMLCPIAIKHIGMGLGLLVWGSVSMIMGWASGRFGLFGLHKQEIGNPDLNSIGVALSMIGLLIFLQVKTNDTSVDKIKNDSLNKRKGEAHHVYTPLTDNEIRLSEFEGHSDIEGLDVIEAAVLAAKEENDSKNSRITGLICATIAGVFFGCSFDPSQYVIDNQYDGEDNSLNYVFAHYCGILMTSWFYTICYCLYKYITDSKPYVLGDIVVPGTISGILWGIAQIAWFYANGQLGFTVTFPIISCGPGFIGSLWGIFVFKEITGKRNIGLLIAAAAVTLPALILVGISH